MNKHSNLSTIMRISICAVCIFFLQPYVYASNLVISNVEMASYDTSANTATIQFDIVWDYTWRNSTNYDAVWIFVKFIPAGGGNWQHVTLKTSGTNPSGFSTGTDAGSDGIDIEVIVPTDRKGCFIQPSDTIEGDGDEAVDVDGIQIVWDYSTAGSSVTDANVMDTTFRVFGIEMVYVPTGGFYAGDHNTSDGSFIQGSTPDTDPWYIASENAISVEDVTGDGYYYQEGLLGGGDGDGAEFIIPNSYPKGYAAFYMMKHELSQGMYRDFLNTLTATQKNSRTQADLSDADDANVYVMIAEGQVTPLSRQTIKALPDAGGGSDYTFVCDLEDDDIGNQSNDGEWIAMNYSYWVDLCAFADWAALRPMTELEFEKACRGVDVLSVAGEYVWGSANIAQAESTFYNAGKSSETTTNVGTDYLCAYGGTITGPFRCGFAATFGSDRESAGAAYYGALNMAGNVWEVVVTVGNATGRAFRGTHGDGELSSGGYADNSDWPGYDGTQVTQLGGSGERGSSFMTDAVFARTSDRYWAAFPITTRSNLLSGRAVRTAP